MITVYSKPNCPFCMKAKYLLEKAEILFSEVDISQNTDSRDWVLSEGHRTVPQLYVNNQLLVEGGYQALEKLTTEEILDRVSKLQASTRNQTEIKL